MPHLYRLLLILIVILASSAVGHMASVVQSPHNLSYPTDYHAAHADDWWDYNEVCVYCHTPHNAVTKVPLWNRQLPERTSFTTYQSPSMEAMPGYPSESSLLCLSCHDGTIALDAVANVGSSGITPSDNWGYSGTEPYPDSHAHMSESCISCHEPNPCHCSPDSDYRGTIIGAGGNLSDDHPISVQYINSSGLHPRPTNDVFSNSVKLIEGRVECASCHNPHDPTIRPFLRASNASSALCYTCHDK